MGSDPMGTITVSGSAPWALSEPITWRVQQGELALLVTVGNGTSHAVLHLRLTPGEADHVAGALAAGYDALVQRSQK